MPSRGRPMGPIPSALGFASARVHDPVVYFAHDRATGLVKIGTSRNLAPRLRRLELELRRGLDLLATVTGGHRVEHALHARFREDRAHGEWFRLSDQLRAAIESARATAN
jgi:hypothetical protein